MLQQDYQFFVQHGNRKSYQNEFIRCDDKSCDHCDNMPQRNNGFLETIKSFGGTCPAPEEKLFYPGHYETFLEFVRTAAIPKSQVINNCTENGICSYGCAYAFFSKSDKDNEKMKIKPDEPFISE